MSYIYHITNNNIQIQENGLNPSDNINEIPNDSRLINKIANENNINYPIKRGQANFFFPNLDSIPYNYRNNHIVVVDIKKISRDIYIGDRDIRDDIIFGEKSDEKIMSYINSIRKIKSSNINKYIENISGTPEVIIHKSISKDKISKICRGKFLSEET